MDRGRKVVELPEAEVPALESVAEFLGHAMDVSMQMVEERSVYYREEELPVPELEEPPTTGRGSPIMEMRLRGRPEDRHVRPESQLWNRGWRSTSGWQLLIFLPYFRGQLGTSPVGRVLTHVTWLGSWMATGLSRWRRRRSRPSTGPAEKRPRCGGARGMKKIGRCWKLGHGKLRNTVQ